MAYYLPAPTDRQIWAHDLRRQSSVGDSSPALEGSQAAVPGFIPGLIQLSSDSGEPTVAMAFKTIVEDFGPTTFVRVYQGQIVKGQTLISSRTGKRHRFSKLVRIHADRRTEIDVAEAGDLCGVVGLDSVLGETYVDDNFSVALENITVAEPVLQRSIEPEGRGDAERLLKALDRFRRQDPTFRFWKDAQSGQLIIAGMGQLHLDVYVQRLHSEHQCNVRVGRPQVAYKQRPTRSVKFEYRFKKQNGGQGQFAEIAGRLEVLPVDSETDFQFCDEVRGGCISSPYITAVREGVEEALSSGPLGGYPVVGLRFVLEDGVEHEKDSSEMAFRRCAWEAMREVVLPQAAMELLEPIVRLELEVPSECQGNVVGDLSRKRVVLSASRDMDGVCQIVATAPLAEMLDYANEIRSLTQGKGTFSMLPDGYQPLPQRLIERKTGSCGVI